jgi:hypothetical protein
VDYVRDKQVDWLNKLIAHGVVGFRWVSNILAMSLSLICLEFIKAISRIKEMM